MSEPDTTAYGESWYAATMVEAPPRPRSRLRSRCRCLRHRRRACRADHGARDRPPRLVGRAAGSRPPRRQCLGPQHRIRAAGFCRRRRQLVARVGFERTKDLWALSQAGLDYVRNAIREKAPYRRRFAGRLALCLQGRQRRRILRFVALLGELGCEIEGWPTERVRAVLRSERYFHAIHYLRAITYPPAQLCAWTRRCRRTRRRAHFRKHAGAVDRSAGVRKRIVTPAARLARQPCRAVRQCAARGR
jgi:hypothetical protein